MRGQFFSRCARLALLFGLTLALCHFAYASDTTAESAADLSNKAFNLLNSINANGSGNPLAGPIANFAADAQTLSQMLASGDRTAAAAQMSTLLADRAAVASAIRGSSEIGAWGAINHQLEALAKVLPPSQRKPSAITSSAPAATGGEAGGSGLGSAATASIPSETTAAAPERIGPMPAASSSSEPPKAVIESRSDDGGVLRIKGYLEGTALTGGGIYQNGQLIKPLKIDPVQGEQRIDFDIGLGTAEPGMSIRVYDSRGRSAKAFASAPEAVPANPEPGSTAGDEGIEVDRSHSAAEAPEGNTEADTAEIPSHGYTRPSPSKRHTLESHLGDVKIDVVAIRQISVTPPMYEVMGVIQGRDVTHAGIYIDGRLAARIPTSIGATTNNLDQRFVMDGGSASIRAFGVGDHYAEQPIDLSTAVAAATPPLLGSSMSGPAMMGGPAVITGAPANALSSTISIQIESVTNLSPTRTVVTGVINGRNVRTAGLYQNGMPEQMFAVGAGPSGLLGSVLSHFGTQTVPFTAYFNPANGPAMIRATDSTGAYTQQPIGIGGINAYMSAPPGAGIAPPAGSW